MTRFASAKWPRPDALGAVCGGIFRLGKDQLASENSVPLASLWP